MSETRDGSHPSSELLRRFGNGEVHGTEAEAIHKHLQSCSVCTQVLDKTQRDPNLAAPSSNENTFSYAPGPTRSEKKLAGHLPERVGRYRIEYEIARGGMGQVVYVVDEVFQRPLAMKIVLDDGSNQHARQRFVREALLTGQLQHPGIPPVQEMGQLDDGRPYFIMKLIRGGDLKDLLRNRPSVGAELPRFVAIFEQICQTLGYAHSHGIIHRDLKPANIMVGAFGEVQVMDWGLAKVLSPKDVEPDPAAASGQPSPAGSVIDSDSLPEETVPGAVLGTSAYMPPEQARGDETLDARCDVFGLGGILGEILTGKPPFAESTSTGNQLLARAGNLDSALARLDGCGAEPELVNLAKCCLAPTPSDRPKHAGVVAEAVAQYQQALQERMHQAEIARAAAQVKEREERKRRRVSLTLAAVVLTLIAGAAAAYFKITHDASDRDLRIAQERTKTAEEIADAEHHRLEAEVKQANIERAAAHAALVNSARDRGRRGDWIAALPQFDRVIQDGEADSLRLRVERLVAYFALNDTPKLLEELDALERLNLGDLKAQVKLTRGAWLLCDFSRQADGRALVRLALKDRHHLFSDADRFFAEALAAERVGQALRLLQRAVDEDPMHYLAANSLVVALAAVGELDKARQQARFVRGIFHFSPMPHIGEAIVALLEDDPAGMKKQLAGAKDKLPPGRRSDIVRLEKFLVLINQLQQIGTRVSAADSELAVWFELPTALLLLARIQQVGKLPNPEPLGLPVPTVSLFYRRFAEVFAVYVELGPEIQRFSAGPAVLARLKDLNDDFPDAASLLMAGSVQLLMCVGPMNSGNMARARNMLEEASDLGWRATTAPNILPGSSIPYLARCLGIMADLIILKIVPRADANLERVRGNLHQVIAEGKKWPRLRQAFISKYVHMTTTPLVRRQCVEWQLDNPPGKAAFEKRRQDLATLARILLDDWALSEPNHADIPRLRGDLARWLSSSGILEEKKNAPVKK